MRHIKIATSHAALIEDGGWVTVTELDRHLQSDTPLLAFFLGTHFVVQVVQGHLNLSNLRGRPGAEYWLPIVRTGHE